MVLDVVLIELIARIEMRAADLAVEFMRVCHGSLLGRVAMP